MKRVFLIHGWEGYPEEGWRPWLKKELEKREFKVTIPTMPDTNNPTLEKWASHLIKISGQVSERDFFIGHSLGCVTILRFLETLKPAEKIGGAVLVAGFGKDLKYSDYKKELSSFFQKPLDWAKIKKHCPKFIAVHSDNDPYVPLSHGYLFKKRLGAKLIIEHNMGHFSGDDNIFRLPIVLDVTLKMSREK